MALTELTDDELNLVLKHRENRKAEQGREQRKNLVIAMVYRYNEWLRDNGAGSSYSTFCDEFGFNGENRQSMYNAIIKIMEIAFNEACSLYPKREEL